MYNEFVKIVFIHIDDCILFLQSILLAACCTRRTYRSLVLPRLSMYSENEVRNERIYFQFFFAKSHTLLDYWIGALDLFI